MYAQLPVFQYQTFDLGSVSFSPIPLSPSPTMSSGYTRPITDLRSKPAETPTEASAGPDTSPSAGQSEGQH